MTYRLASLQTTTAWDTPLRELRPHGAVHAGDASALGALEGAARAPHRLARVTRPEALLVLHLEPLSRPAALVVTLVVDGLADAAWHRARVPEAGPLQPPDQHRTRGPAPLRLLGLRVGAELRGAAVLRGSDAGPPVTARVPLLVHPGDVGVGGVVVLGIDGLDTPPSFWQGAPDPAVGVAVARVQLLPQAPAQDAWTVGRRLGGLVVNPTRATPPLTLWLAPRVRHAAPPPPSASPARRLARARHRTLAAVAGREREVVVQLLELVTGRRRTARLAVDEDGWARLPIDPREGPVAVRPTPGGLGGRAPWAWDWVARVDS